MEEERLNYDCPSTISLTGFTKPGAFHGSSRFSTREYPKRHPDELFWGSFYLDLDRFKSSKWTVWVTVPGTQLLITMATRKSNDCLRPENTVQDWRR